MRDEIAKYLQDVLDACGRLQAFAGNRTFADYQADEMLRAAVERKFIIVGEALREAQKLDRPALASLPNLKEIIGFRNILVHGYADIEDTIVWGAMENHVPVLIREVQALLATADPV